MYFFALLENGYCEKDGNSQRETFSLRRNKNYILGRHNISDGASDADWQKRRIAAFVVVDLPFRQIRLNCQQSRATENDPVRIIANMEEISVSRLSSKYLSIRKYDKSP